MKKIVNFFKLKEHNTSVKVEIYAGIATFLAMAYILVVNPNNLLIDGNIDPRWSSVFVATAIGSFIGTLLMALIANTPFGASSTMGVNAMIGTVIGGSLGFSFSYGNGMLIILCSGIVFFLLSVIPVGKKGCKVSLREALFDGMPKCIINAVPVGIGLFITFIGLKNSGIIISNKYTLLQLLDFGSSENFMLGGPAWGAIVTLFGLVVIAVLTHYKVKGSVIIGILSSTLLAIPTKVANLDILLGKVDKISWKFWENISSYFSNDGVFLSVFKEGFNLPEGSLFTFIILVMTFIMLDLFDTIGTIVGCATNAGLNDENGKPEDYNKIMYADSATTVMSAIVGTSTVSTFVESGAGIAEGGKTGLTGLTIAILFLLSIFFLPLFAFIPIEAASSALIYVGVLMIKNIKTIDFDNVIESVPAFLTIIVMPLAYSITDGIGIGVITYFFINLFIYFIDLVKGNKKKFPLSIVTTCITILFLIYFLVPTIV